MKLYTDSQAKQHFSDLLVFAENEDVMIKRKRWGIIFTVAKKATIITF